VSPAVRTDVLLYESHPPPGTKERRRAHKQPPPQLFLFHAQEEEATAELTCPTMWRLSVATSAHQCLRRVASRSRQGEMLRALSASAALAEDSTSRDEALTRLRNIGMILEASWLERMPGKVAVVFPDTSSVRSVVGISAHIDS
jgi:DNA-directed RNA polymerase specialized sigma54-like protein